MQELIALRACNRAHRFCATLGDIAGALQRSHGNPLCGAGLLACRPVCLSFVIRYAPGEGARQHDYGPSSGFRRACHCRVRPMQASKWKAGSPNTFVERSGLVALPGERQFITESKSSFPKNLASLKNVVNDLPQPKRHRVFRDRPFGWRIYGGARIEALPPYDFGISDLTNEEHRN